MTIRDYILVVTLACVSCTEDSTTSILGKVQTNLEKIHTATYTYQSCEWYRYAEEKDGKKRTDLCTEQDDPSDIFAGCRMIEEAKNGDIYCYDGKRRMRTNHHEKGTYEIDSLFDGLGELRPVSIPFYHTCRRLIAYAISPSDSTTMTLTKVDSQYILDLTIFSQTQVEFNLAKPDPHLPQIPGILDPTEHYTLNIDCHSMLPVEIYRQNENDCYRYNIVGQPLINAADVKPIDCLANIPEGFTEYKRENRDSYSLMGKQIPEFELIDGDGRKVAMKGGKGKARLIMFTGIGCGRCLEAIPFVNRVNGMKNVDVVALETWGHDASTVRAYSRQKNIAFTLLVGGADVMQRYALGQGVPQFVVVSPDGSVSARYVGWSDAVGDSILTRLGR